MIVAVCAAHSLLADPAVAPIRYTLRFPDPASHHVEVEAVYPTEGRVSVTLKMAVWTAYVVREYAQHIERLDGPPGTEKIRKNRWRVPSTGAPSVTVRYRLYANSMHVQDNYVDTDFALINGQPTFLTLADGVERPHEVKFELPRAWRTSVAPIPLIAPHTYRARDYEELIDSPIVLGNPVRHAFESDGASIQLINVGEKGAWDGAKSVGDLRKLVRAQREIWGAFPVPEYTFFNILSSKGGGMEHAASTVMMASHDATKRRETYVRWLNLASHELFHLWNVKRLRPREIAPGEYEEEQYTPSLGIAEGFTTYYAAVALRRAGVIGEDEYREELRRQVESVQASEGRKVQTLAESSFDTWIKFYRPSENSARTTISYYAKGAAVGMLLDARIRAATNGAKSLDHVMRLALERYPRERGYTLDEFRAVASEVAGTDLTDWFRRAFHTTEELDYREAERVFGFKLTR
ncbi:MAG: hypothetical protein SFV18_18665 [Bryobacteraceae bacterium]|nr:hypothetical protein [Bryobacteraceae bacterium]